MDEEWRYGYQTKKEYIKGEYIPCPGSICHFTLSLPNEEEVEEEEETYPKEVHYP